MVLQGTDEVDSQRKHSRDADLNTTLVGASRSQNPIRSGRRGKDRVAVAATKEMQTDYVAENVRERNSFA